MSIRRLLALLLCVPLLAVLVQQLPAGSRVAHGAPVGTPLVAAKAPAAALLPLAGVGTEEPDASAQPPSAQPGTPPGTTAPTAPPDCTKLKCVALTMDDGPVPGTAKVLDLLKRRGVHATFFVLGSLARRHPALVKRMVTEGHVVGNHSWNHPEFFGESARMVRGQLARTDTVLHRETGHDPVLMRPPFGEVTAKVRRTCRSLREAIVLWDVDPLDWKDRKASTVAKRVVKQARRGSIILTHDSLRTTRAAYADIIDGLRARGFTLVTVPELFGGRLRPGKVYLRG